MAKRPQDMSLDELAQEMNKRENSLDHLTAKAEITRRQPRDHGMEHQADVHPQLRLILPDAGPGCEKNGRRATCRCSADGKIALGLQSQTSVRQAARGSRRCRRSGRWDRCAQG